VGDEGEGNVDEARRVTHDAGGRAPMVGCEGKGASTNGDEAPRVVLRATRRISHACDLAPAPRRPERSARPAPVAVAGQRAPGPRIVESAIAESCHISIGTAGNLG
jgi:hypothetical protein